MSFPVVTPILVLGRAGLCCWLLWCMCCEPTVAAVVGVRDQGSGCDYLSGDRIVLPAAQLNTNLLTEGAQVVLNRPHTAKPALFDESGRLKMNGTHSDEAAVVHSPFPPYLHGQQYVTFLQEVRHYTNYTCTITTDAPAAFYLLIDNRVNEFSEDKSYSDPVFGPPDTEWVTRDGWTRVNTGLTPVLTETNRGDYVAIDEGNNGSINQAYAIYQRVLDQPGTVTVGTQFEGNIYCVVVSTNLPTQAQHTKGKGTNVVTTVGAAAPKPLARR